MDFSRKVKNKKKTPSKVFGLPKLETLTQEQREKLYKKNFEELAALRHDVYSSLDIWPGNTFLPAGQTASASASERSAQQQHQTNGVSSTDQHQHQHNQQPQQQQQKLDMGKQRLEQKQTQHQDSERQMRQFQEGSKVLQNGSHDRSEDFAVANGWPKDLSENKNYFNTPGLTNGSSMTASGRAKVLAKPDREITVDESSDFESSSMVNLDQDSSDFEQF
ncbi:hypothetical protein RRG08_044583 [Elysia crispata]|uniref:Uncharacterized protein n=1 Tax=Elysia crispata TaxID=231223 RepID=A0AAE1DLL2_9GAST|nr:hypothetical protein RRG08_044583 [Elysia crispata]